MNILDIIKNFWPIIVFAITSIIGFIVWLIRLEGKVKVMDVSIIVMDGKICRIEEEYKKDFKFMEDNYIKMNDKIYFSINEIKEIIVELKESIARLDERTGRRKTDIE
jgi:hypothetical protein